MKRFTLAPILFLFLLAAAGCQQIKQIPLFNPEARALNRVGSANEIITELNNKTADYVARGWITQAKVNETLGPALDKAAQLADATELLLRAGEQQAGEDRLESLKGILESIRDQLAALEKEQSVRRRAGP